MDIHTNIFERVATQVHDLVLFAAVAFFFGLVKIFTTTPAMPLRYNLITLFTSVLIGTLAGEVALELQSLDFIALSVTSVASLLSRDIVAGLLNKQFMAGLAKRATENVVDKVTK